MGVAMQQNKEVSVLSYNLYCLPGFATAFSPASCPLPAERSAAFLKKIPAYDIIALQEVWDPAYRSIAKYAKANNLHVVGSSAPSALRYLTLRVFGGGLMIMSKYPIVDTQEIIFDKGSQSDRFVTKGVLYAKVKVGGSYIHVFNTHLQASYGYEFDFETNPYIPMRHKQLKRMNAFIEKLTAKDQYPIMVMGDFNVNSRVARDDGSDSKEYIDMINLLQSRQYEIVDVLKEHNEGKHPVTYGGQGVLPNETPKIGGQRLDYILNMKKDASVHDLTYTMTEGKVVTFQVTGEKYTHISDHFGQSVVVRMSGEGLRERDTPASNPLAQASISLGAM